MTTKLPALHPARRSVPLRRSFGLAMVLICTLVGTAPGQQRIILDSPQLSIRFEVYSLGIWRITGGFREASAEITYNAEVPNLSRLTVMANTSSISTSSPATDAYLRSPSFFDAERHPILSFESTKVAFTSPSRGIVAGNLRLLGVTRPVRLTFELRGGASASKLLPAGRIYATGILRRSEWGMTALTPAVSDDVRLEIDAEARIAR